MLFLLNSDKITFSKKQFRGIVLGMTALVIFLNAKWFITSGDDSYTHLDTYVSAGDSKKKISGTALKHPRCNAHRDHNPENVHVQCFPFQKHQTTAESFHQKLTLLSNQS